MRPIETDDREPLAVRRDRQAIVQGHEWQGRRLTIRGYRRCGELERIRGSQWVDANESARSFSEWV